MSISDPSSRISRRADAAALWAAALFPSLATWLYFVVLSQHPSAAVQASLRGGKNRAVRFSRVLGHVVQRQKLRLARPSTAGVAEGLALGVAVLAGMLLLYFSWLKPAGYLAAAVEPITAKATALGMGSPAPIHPRRRLAVFGPRPAGRVLLAVVPLRRPAAIHAGRGGRDPVEPGLHRPPRDPPGGLFRRIVPGQRSSFPSAWPSAGRPGPGSITAADRSWARGSATS